MDNSQILKMLERPSGKVDVVLDTDTFNEIDDQYALAYMIQSKEKFNVVGVYAAPFLNHHSNGPKDGMEKSYEEILRVYKLLNRPELEKITFKGSVDFLVNSKPKMSDAVQHLIDLALAHSSENPLYVIGIAAATNIATAILLEPKITENIVVLWLGGLGYEWHNNLSFNCRQDLVAARVLLDTPMPLVQFPGMGVISAFATTGPELEYWLKGKNKFCDYMVTRTEEEAKITNLKNGGKVWSRALWDVVPIGWLLGEEFMKDKLVNSPIMQDNHYYSQDFRRHFIKYVYFVERDKLMEDLFEKLAKIDNN
ncbi:nucleoside hydrolase [Listeria monocytogenes]|uniref:nucleoside hydrolase n=1 Tax=Listeria monocytogenes TaxID=1639 RepID=UPI000853FC33|nr:nucleoside hydrolase [Listeria monocytogenes]EAC7885961.1 nucleoside hydrolase [Listeria monocytogenes]EAD2799160.1 nucleoside hydrolase [Listeria monocytogenes]EAD7213539.1 nucleoside hydrolase [Listeria monocytogenes]EAD7603509.1 nucleoside hydrolase [Listeria monocytogenes]EAE0011500.1 nucleoside hydrolase [Listeria monocytogenes]